MSVKNLFEKRCRMGNTEIDEIARESEMVNEELSYSFSALVSEREKK